MSDTLPDAAPPEEESGSRRPWRRWISAALFALIALCFVLPFASTSCTLPGGYGRGAMGTTTTYRGIDLAVNAVPAVTPADKPARADATVNAGQLGFQPLVALALLGVLVGIGLAGRGAALVAAWAAGTAVVLAAAEVVTMQQIADQITASGAQLPGGKTPADYIVTGQGFGLAVVLLGVAAAVNAAAAAWPRRRPLPGGAGAPGQGPSPASG